MSLQGPVLSAHKKLIAEKLADEEAERKVKGEAKKEKHMVFFSYYPVSLSLSLQHQVHLGTNFVVFTVIFPSTRISLSVLHFFLTEKGR